MWVITNGPHIDPITALRNAVAAGVEGGEVFYPYATSHRPNGAGIDWISCLAALAVELGLLQTGGADFHGRPHDTVDLGDMGLTEAQFAALKESGQKLRSPK